MAVIPSQPMAWNHRHLSFGCREPIRTPSQSPEAGTAVVFGATIHLEENGLDDPDCTVDPELVAIAQSFIDFARGAIGKPLTAGSVDLYVGNSPAGTIPEAAVGDRSHWKGCPPAGAYAAVNCPVSFLNTIVSLDVNGVTPQFTSADPGGICMVMTGSLPASLTASYSFVTIVPESSFATCASNFAIQLFVDTDDRIVAVNLVLTDP